TLAIANDVSYDLFPLPNFEGAYSPAALPRLIVASAFVFFGSLVVFARPLFEFFVEVPTRVMYRIRAKGLGIPAFPTRGPVMFLANHAAYLDPLFLAADIPRPLTPMMTSKFYDRWFIYPIVKYL